MYRRWCNRQSHVPTSTRQPERPIDQFQYIAEGEIMFADLKVSTRLAVAFATIIVLLAVVITLGVSRMAVLNNHLHAITDENDPEASLANELQSVAYDIGVSVRDIIIITDTEKLRARHEELLTDYQHMDDTVEKLNRMFTSIASTTSTEKELISKIRTA